MKKLMTLCLLATVSLLTASAQRTMRVRKNVPLDSIRLSDPAILADQKTRMYYMTGTGGMMWRSADLKLWEGPFRVTEFETDSWMGPRPMIWAAELHQTSPTLPSGHPSATGAENWYYYFATFTNQAVKIDTVRGNVIERRASQVLRADNPMGPYRAFGDATYLPADRPTLDGTFWRDTDGKPYMVFCGEWLQNWNGTIEKIELKPDLSGTIGEPKVLFRASDSPWSRERNDKGEITWNKVTDGPWLFRTGTGRLGMLWTSWVYDVYTQGVAYSESGTLDGPWTQEPQPITPPGYGHSMLFQRFDGQWMMSVHYHQKDARGRTVRTPHLFEVDLSGDALVVHGQDLKLNNLDYFERQGVNVLVFSNSFNGGFNDEKNSGIEIIHHGVRTVQGGAVRLNNTPEQWDLVPTMTDRKVDKVNGSIEVTMRYDDYDFDSRVVVTAKGKAVEMAVYLDKPVPEKLAGEAGFNLEFLPSQYWLKTFIMDGRLNRFPRYATSQTVTRPNSEKPRQFKGFKTYDDRGTDRFVDPLPLETGHRIVMATDDPERMISITSDDAELKLYDGRMLAQNGWFVLRSVLPKGKTGKVVTWTVEPHAIPNWIRQPNIGFSQIGYTPEQPKVAVIELDKNDTPQATATLMRIKEDGSTEQAFQGPVKTWGPYYKYNYVKFDFSSVRQPGVYYIQYGQTKTNDFLIDAHVYDKITDATTDVWVPIHMNHMYVTEGYRTWHGEPFKEGYLQAPESDHFDLHRQGATTDTKYKPLELIPGLNIGGFFDAGDFDIETSSNINVVQNLIRTWELFKPQRDEAFVSEQQRYVELHRPDGVPDILQFIEHGVLNLVAQAEQIGHMAQTLSNSVLDNYHHLGDAASITDGLHYDPSLKPYEVSADGKSSGTPDDMWAFTTRNPRLDLQAAGVFTSAARVLRGYNNDLADRAQKQANRLRQEAEQLLAQHQDWRDAQAEADDDWLTGLGNVVRNLQTALDSIPMKDEAYKQKLRPAVEKYNDYIHSFDTQNPYGVPIGLGNWAGVNAILNFGITVNYAHIYYPDIVSKDEVYRVANWLYGCHPYHNYSFVAVVGATRPKQVFYGNNRADFSAIPGNVAPGLLFRKPDHFENYDDWPFLWGQNEGTIAGNTQYIIFGSSFKNIVNNQ